MPTETRGNILFQPQLVLREMTDQVDRNHVDGWFRVTALSQPPRVVQRKIQVDVEEDTG